MDSDPTGQVSLQEEEVGHRLTEGRQRAGREGAAVCRPRGDAPGNQPCWRLALGLLTARTLRQHISVV